MYLMNRFQFVNRAKKLPLSIESLLESWAFALLYIFDSLTLILMTNKTRPMIPPIRKFVRQDTTSAMTAPKRGPNTPNAETNAIP